MSPITIPQRRGALLVLLLTAIAFPIAMLVALGPLTLRFGSPVETMTSALMLVSRVIPVLGALFAGTILVRLLRDPRPRLAIDDLGVRSVWIRDGLLAWRDIAEATARHESDDVTHAELLCLRLRRPEDAVARLDPLPGPLGALARRQATRSGAIEINVVGSGHTPEALAELINARLARSADAAAGGTARGTARGTTRAAAVR